MQPIRNFNVLFHKCSYYITLSMTYASPRVLRLYNLCRLTAMLNACLNTKEVFAVLNFTILQPVFYGLNR
jgi:hypothetical protein